MSIPQERKCKICQKVYPLSSEYWHRDSKAKYGLRTFCKPCAKVRNKEYRERDLESYNEKQRKRYRRDIDKRRAYNAANAERIATYKREWRKANPDKVKKHKRDSAKRHPESHNKRNKRYRDNHPEKMRQKSRTQWARRKTTEGKYTQKEIDRLYEEQHGYCAYCGIRLFDRFHVDHVVPISRGGTNHYDNLLLACPHCNQSKNDKLIEEWEAMRGW